jgi:hypothetical protein
MTVMVVKQEIRSFCNISPVVQLYGGAYEIKETRLNLENISYTRREP